MAFYDNYLSYINKLRDSLQDSPLVIELKSRYASLEHNQQQIIKLSIIVLVFFIVFFFPLILFISASSVKSEISRMDELTEFLNYSASEMQELRQIISSQQQNVDTSITPTTPVKEIAQKYLTQANVREDSYSIQDSASPDALTLSLSKVSLRQITKILFALESSPAGLDLSQVDIDTRSDPKGYMWSTISFKKKPMTQSSVKDESSKKSFSR